MTQPPENKKNDLLERLQGVQDESLERKVEKTEGVNGSTVEPIYSARKMRCYSVTESELKQIGLANLGITAFASLGSAMLAFSLDVFKDTLLAEQIPKEADLVISYLQPILLFVGVGLWIMAGLTLRWRRSMIELVKEESTNP